MNLFKESKLDGPKQVLLVIKKCKIFIGVHNKIE